MSLKATKWAWETDLPPNTQKLVLLALAHCHNSKNGQCNPRIETITEMVGCSKRAAQYALKELEGLGYIRAIRRRKGARQASNQYALALDGVVFQSATPRTLKPKKKCADLHPENAPDCTLYIERQSEHRDAHHPNVVEIGKFGRG